MGKKKWIKFEGYSSFIESWVYGKDPVLKGSLAPREGYYVVFNADKTKYRYAKIEENGYKKLDLLKLNINFNDIKDNPVTILPAKEGYNIEIEEVGTFKYKYKYVKKEENKEES